MFCINCGKKIANEADVCIHCGKRVNKNLFIKPINESKKSENKNNIILLIIIPLACVLFLGILVFLVSYTDEGNQNYMKSDERAFGFQMSSYVKRLEDYIEEYINEYDELPDFEI